MQLSWDEKVKKYGKLNKNDLYLCTIENYKDKDQSSAILKYVNEDDVSWRTTSGLEFNEISWSIISWEKL